MIINNISLLIIGSVFCVLGSIPTLCLCCCKNNSEIILIEKKNNIFNSDVI